MTRREFDCIVLGLGGFGSAAVDSLMVGGSSPSTVSVYDVDAGQRVAAVNLSMDIRNAIHGLEVWPFS